MTQEGLSFGKTVYLWRYARGLTQGELASRAELSRPNLSMVEQGARDVTLGTLRRIASALNIQPGILADGLGPAGPKNKPLSRGTLDRISRFLLGERIRLGVGEKKVANLVYSITKRKLGNKGDRALPRTAREERNSWEKLKGLLRDEEINNLIRRIEKRSFVK